LLLALGINHIIRLWATEGRPGVQRQRMKKGQLELPPTTVAGRPDNKLALMERTTGRIEVPLLLECWLTLTWHSPGRHAPFHCRMQGKNELETVDARTANQNPEDERIAPVLRLLADQHLIMDVRLWHIANS